MAEDRSGVAVTRMASSPPGNTFVPRWFGPLSDVWDVGVVVLNPGHQVDFASRKARELVGARTDEEFDAAWQALAPDVERALPGCVTAGEPLDLFLELLIGGARQRLRVQAYPVVEEDCVGHLLLLQQGDRAIAVETALRSAARDRGHASLYRDLGHDIKGALNALTLNVELLRQALDTDPGAGDGGPGTPRRCLSVIDGELRRIMRALGALLDGTQVESESRQRVDVTRLVRGVADLVRARCRRQKVELEVLEAPVEAVVDGHADQLHAALLSLVVNALEAMADGGVLTLSVAAEVGLVRLAVCDTGPGVPEGWERKMWALHATTKPGGTGIGLHVARSIVKAHGGSIRYARAAQGPTCFVAELPAARSQGA